MKVPKLTKRSVDALKPAEKPYVAWCGALPGFGISVRPTGVMSFIAQYDFGGRAGSTRRATLGRYGVASGLTVEQARKLAEEILHDAKRGVDHVAAKAKRRAQLTVAQLCDEYLEHGCEHKKASTIAMDVGRINRHVRPCKIANMKIGDVQDVHIERLLKDIAEGKTAVKREGGKGYVATGGKSTATRTIRMLGSIFSYAVKRKYIAENPCKGAELYPDKKGERFLSSNEIQRLGDTLREAETVGLPWQPKSGPNAKHIPKKAAVAREIVSPFAIGAIRLLMLTGCRLREILNLRWSQVDLERGSLDLLDSKTGAKKILIGAAAAKVLEDLQSKRVEGNPYVIPGEAKGKPRSDLKRPWKRITDHAGLNVGSEGNPKPLRLHDLRHSFASMGVASNLGLSIVGKLLGHASPTTTQRYAHIGESAERRALNEIENRIAAAAGMIETAEVIDYKRDAV